MSDRQFENENENEDKDKVIDVAYTDEKEAVALRKDKEVNIDEMQKNDIYEKNEVTNAQEDTVHEGLETYYHETIKDPDKNKKKNTEKTFGKLVKGILIGSIVGGVSIGISFAFASPYAQASYNEKNGINTKVATGNEYTMNTQETSSPIITTTAENHIPAIAEMVGPSVVSINNNSTVTTWKGEFSQSSLGSGVIFHQDNEKVYIISNAHVVDGANTLTVNFIGNVKVAAQIVGADTSTDITVISVNKEDLPEDMRDTIQIATLGDSDALRVGEQVVAIGTPIDEAYRNTVTVGYVSALEREVSLTDQKINLIQTDAAINPGNSGGALVGPSGEVIGINTMKLVDSDSKIEGMGFAIPINDVKPIVEELMTHGKIMRPSLGIMGENLSEAFGSYWEMPVGILVHQVILGSSADIAGIQQGDVIIEFDGTRITTMEALKEILRTKEIGDQVKVKIVRGSDKKTIDVKLQAAPDK
ncbi:MAG: S1C family serine protease [Cellulosilyticaceae bacterium]